jgi:hypothetical protein
VRLKVDARLAPAGLIGQLKSLLREYPGESKVYLTCLLTDGPQTYEFGSGFKVTPDGDFYAEVKALLGEAAVL